MDRVLISPVALAISSIYDTRIVITDTILRFCDVCNGEVALIKDHDIAISSNNGSYMFDLEFAIQRMRVR